MSDRAGESAWAAPTLFGVCRSGVLVVARAPSGAARECSEYQVHQQRRVVGTGLTGPQPAEDETSERHDGVCAVEGGGSGDASELACLARLRSGQTQQTVNLSA